MKRLILLSLIYFTGYSGFAQLPDIVGEKASIKQLESSYESYTVEEGRLLDVGSGDNDDNVYLNASISGMSLDTEFLLTSNSNGVVTSILYLFDNIQEDHFTFLKSTTIKVHKAQLISNANGISTYTSTIFGINRYIIFTRQKNGKAIVSFKLR